MITNIRLDLNDEQLRKISGKSRSATRKEVMQFVLDLLEVELRDMPLRTTGTRKRTASPLDPGPEPELGDD